MNNEFGCLIFLIICASIIFVTQVIVNVTNANFYNEQICTQLYQQTQNYQSCITKDVNKNIKLIKVIDKEN